MPKEKDHIIIQLFPSSEGGICYNVFNDDCDGLYEMESDDGGLCTSETHEPKCRYRDGHDCACVDGPTLTRKDYVNALGMAVNQALDLLFPKK